MGALQASTRDAGEEIARLKGGCASALAGARPVEQVMPGPEGGGPSQPGAALIEA